MADRTSCSIRIRTIDVTAFEEAELFPDISESDVIGVSDCEDSEFVPDFTGVTALGLPFYGGHGSHTGTYSAFKVAFDGVTYMEHSCDEDGDLAIPGLLGNHVFRPVTEIPQGTLDFVAHYRRCIELVHTNPADLCPPDFEFTTKHEQDMHVAWVKVPVELLEFANSRLGNLGSPVIGTMPEGELILHTGEDFAEERVQLLADGWPEKFIDFLAERTAAGWAYFRLFA